MSDLADYRHGPATRRLLRSLIAVVCPPEAESLGVVDQVIDESELSMRSMPPVVRAMLRAGMTTYDLAAVARYGRRASALPADAAHAWFDWWAHGLPLQRQFAKGIKALLAMSYYELPAVRATLDYTPEQWIEKVKRRRLEQYRDDIAAHERTIFEPDPIPLPSEVARRTEASVQLADRKEASR